MPGTYVYVDGFNFYYGALRHSKYKWLDYEALSRSLLPQDHIEKIRYFTAKIKPLGPGDTGHERQHAYLRAVAANPLIETTFGTFRSQVKLRALADGSHSVRDLFRPHLRPVPLVRGILAEAKRRRLRHHTLARVIVQEEKGTDVSLGAFLVHDALTGQCSKALVLSNDSDLKEAVALAVKASVPVGIVNPHYRQTPSRELTQAATFRIPFRPGVLAKCQLPNTVIGANGKQIHRPREW
ncbi:MAG: NYN domain-containing protein [Acidimicrobiales bacterium]